MNLVFSGKEYRVIDAKEKITIADSFVVASNKIGTGHGEGKLYVGAKGEELYTFFGKPGFVLRCIMLRKDLVSYLNEVKIEYLKPEQPYRDRADLPALWNKRLAQVNDLPEVIEFEVAEQKSGGNRRSYVNSKDRAYQLIRELSLPNVTFISIAKIANVSGSYYYLRLFADYFGESVHPYEIQQEAKEIEEIQDEKEKMRLTRAREGHGEYKKKLLEQCPFCPITMISDDRLLIASHIKPWRSSSVFEKTDPYNGLILTPTFDHLFDKGYMSFTDDKRVIMSPFISKMTCSKLGISDNQHVALLPIHGRESYLEYHRDEILKR